MKKNIDLYELRSLHEQLQNAQDILFRIRRVGLPRSVNPDAAFRIGAALGTLVTATALIQRDMEELAPGDTGP